MISSTSTTTALRELQTLKAGVFSLGYLNGFIRHIHYGDIEVVRSVYMALRDQNWNTFEHTIENEIIDDQGDHFTIEYDCYYEVQEQRIFSWHVLITGLANSVVTFEVQGKAITDVLKNRAGICVLHPIKHTAGNPCELLHPDGSRIKKFFPTTISADNPFKNLKGFRWRCQYEWYVLEFEGDIFETEDQRNWSDASYKTFCTPLDKPFPVQLKAGDNVHQKITFKAESELLPIPNLNKPVEIIALERKSKLPAIGIAASTEVEVLSEEMLQLLHALRLSHYRIEVRPSAPDWIEKFTLDCQNATALKLPLEIGLHIADIKELGQFYQMVNQLKASVKQIILLSTDQPATDPTLVREFTSIKNHLPSTLIGAGTDHNFRELNCNRFDGNLLDFISYSIDPQEHATDDLTIIENIGAQSDTVESARALYGQRKAVHVSSLTLRKRFNPAATVSKDKFLSNDKKADPRQQTPFTAAFTLGSIKTLAHADANSVTYYQTVGRQGVISSAGKKYPVYDVLKEILSDEKQEIVHTESNNPLYCDGLLLKSQNSFKLILVNYTDSPQRVIFRKDEFLLTPYEIKVQHIH
ncbi:hypothetical protein [Chryseolinea sp. H1M3-3]|uniref:hypothetical protein n=1 Tax=Chryseolinea sp. H1M3-3 TaxID=3034144 RepID=UPI0023ED897D|nr:hypothetical protein [Chryseolinea sp. H1M3-3]